MNIADVFTTEIWLKSIFNINKEIDFERENLKASMDRIEELEKQKEEIYKIVDLITNPTHKQILFKRYVQGKKWEQISEEMNFENQHIHRLHKKAIEDAHKIRITLKKCDCM